VCWAPVAAPHDVDQRFAAHVPRSWSPTKAKARRSAAGLWPSMCGVIRTPGAFQNGCSGRKRLRVGDVEHGSQAPPGQEIDCLVARSSTLDLAEARDRSSSDPGNSTEQSRSLAFGGEHHSRGECSFPTIAPTRRGR
jgi:hypothetical protein